MSAPSSSPSPRRPAPAWSIAAAVAAVALVVGGCGSSSKSTKTAPTTATTAASAPTAANPEAVTLDNRQVIVRGRQALTDTAAIEVHDNFFMPNLLTATPGSTVTFNLQSKAAGLHNLTVPGQSVDVDIAAGATATAKVTVPASGQLLFYCKYHRDESGMVGVINAA